MNRHPNSEAQKVRTELDALRADLATVTRERDELREKYDRMTDRCNLARSDVDLMQYVVERLKGGLLGLAGAASASLSEDQISVMLEEPHPDHLRLADFVMSVPMLMIEDGMTYDEACASEALAARRAAGEEVGG